MSDAARRPVPALATSTAWNIAGHAAPLGAALVAIPATLHGLGEERFGALSLAWVLIGYASVFDLGLGRALTRFVAESGEREDEGALAAVTWATLGAMAALGLLGTAAIVLAAPWLVAQVLSIRVELQPEVRTATMLLALSMPFVITTAGLRGLLEARQRFAVVNLIRVPQGILSFAAPALVLPFSNSLVTIMAVLCLLRFATWAVHLALCLRELPWLRRLGRLQPSRAMPLLWVGGWMTVTNIVGPLMTYLDRLLVGGLLTLAAVAHYATPYEVVTKLLLVPAALSQVLFPAFAQTAATDKPRAALLVDRSLRMLLVATFPVTLLLVALAPELLGAWLGPAFARESTRVLQWLALGVFLCGLAQVPFALVQAAGRPDLAARLHLFELPGYVAGVWWLVQVRGVEGVAIAWTVRAAIDAVALLWMADRLVPPLSAGWRLPAFAGTTAALLLVGLAEPGWLRAVSAAGCLAVFVLLVWKHVLTPGERLLARGGLWRALFVVHGEP